MRQKVSTLLEETLFRRAKLLAVRKGMQISEILGEALARYLDDEGSPEGMGGVVRHSFAIINLDKDKVRAVLEEEDGLLDA